MPLRFFRVSASDWNGSRDEQEVNAFLASHRIISIGKQFVADGANSYWSICVEYVAAFAPGSRQSDGVNRVDYREKLSPDEFAIYSELRELRKEVATRHGAPIYTVFTNQQLYEMVVEKVSTRNELSGIGGVGASRIEKFGDEFLMLLSGHFSKLGGGSNAPSREPVSSDS